MGLQLNCDYMLFLKRCSGWLTVAVCFGSLAAALMPTVALAAVEAEASSVTSTDARNSVERLRWLRAEISRHDELYFKKAAPEISDAEYDRLKREMLALEKAFPDEPRAPTGATTSFGDDRNGRFSNYRHREPMLGLEKAYSRAELRAFHSRLEGALGRTDLIFVVEPKFDGIAISVTYEGGRLVRAVTRGNGQEGDDVTANVSTIAELPRELRALSLEGVRNPIPDTVELRGEVYLDYAEFDRINRERIEAGDEPFGHPRNLAAGTLKQKDPDDVAKRGLRVVFFGIGAWQGATKDRPDSQQALHALVRAWGLPGIGAFEMAANADDAWAAVERLGARRTALGFPTDGAVVKLDAFAGQRRLGTSEDAPRWAIAYKFQPERVTTRLRSITLQVGRTGVITPVAELDPVRIGGASISRATLHNAAEIARRDLRIGDFVFVEKAGEIIPAITGVDLSRRTPDAAPFAFPVGCPSCGTTLLRAEDEAATRCPNGRCVAQVRRRIEHFAAPAGVGINGLGPVQIEALVNANKVSSVTDLYRLRREDAVSERILTEIERSKRADLGRFIFGLGIPGIGRKTAEALATRHGSLAILAKARDAELTDATRGLMAELVALGVNPQAGVKMTRSGPGPLAGKTVVLTGSLKGWSRAEAAKRITAVGGRTTTSVSRRTDWVVAGEGAGAKLDEARVLGVPVIDEAELLRLLQESQAGE